MARSSRRSWREGLRSVTRRVPAGQHPIAAHGQSVRVIQVKCLHRRPPHVRHPEEADAVVPPKEVVPPVLLTRVEQRYDLAGVRVFAGRLVTFVAVAEWTTQPEVALVVTASPGAGDDVLDLQPRHDEVLRTEAVTAAVPRRGPDAAI